MVPLSEAEAKALFEAALDAAGSDRDRARDRLGEAMQRTGLLEVPAPPAALRWIETFLDAYSRAGLSVRQALLEVAELRAESTTVPALELERLRNRSVLFFLDTVSQYVDGQEELSGLPLDHDLRAMADEFGIAHDDALRSVRMALTGKAAGPPLELLFPLLGHDRIMMRIGAINSHLLHGRGLKPIEYGPDGQPFATIEGRKPT